MDMQLHAPEHALPAQNVRPHCGPQVPIVDEALAVDIPVMVDDRAGHACLVILPSDKPPVRGEALAVEGLLRELLREPMKAAHKWVEGCGCMLRGCW